MSHIIAVVVGLFKRSPGLVNAVCSDILSIILEKACDSATQAKALVLVCRRWYLIVKKLLTTERKLALFSQGQSWARKSWCIRLDSHNYLRQHDFRFTYPIICTDIERSFLKASPELKLALLYEFPICILNSDSILVEKTLKQLVLYGLNLRLLFKQALFTDMANLQLSMEEYEIYTCCSSKSNASVCWCYRLKRIFLDTMPEGSKIQYTDNTWSNNKIQSCLIVPSFVDNRLYYAIPIHKWIDNRNGMIKASKLFQT